MVAAWWEKRRKVQPTVVAIHPEKYPLRALIASIIIFGRSSSTRSEPSALPWSLISRVWENEGCLRFCFFFVRWLRRSCCLGQFLFFPPHRLPILSSHFSFLSHYAASFPWTREYLRRLEGGLSLAVSLSLLTSKSHLSLARRSRSRIYLPYTTTKKKLTQGVDRGLYTGKKSL